MSEAPAPRSDPLKVDPETLVLKAAPRRVVRFRRRLLIGIAATACVAVSITVTSSAIARSLAKLFGDDLRRSKLASISPLTSGVLRELSFEPAAEATEYTMAGLVEAILTSAQTKAAH